MARAVTETVNLDGLIEREDFESRHEGVPISAGKLSKEISLRSLVVGDRLDLLRKPDFQRETSGWSPEIVVEFIKSVADGDVIPALIMWRSQKNGRTYIIDGAHRLSALVAWVNNDFGDGDLSKNFYGDNIPQEQLEIAKKTRTLVEDTVGKYTSLTSVKDPVTAASPLALARGQNILSEGLSIQAIEGDAIAAEQSYLRINSTAVAISDTERILIDSRRLPTGIATRALMRAGTGYEYWSRFNEPQKSQIKDTAALVYDQLIKPITEYPVLALDLPAPKRGYSANSMKTILDLVTNLNTPSKGTKKKKIEEDVDGTATLECLELIRKVTQKVFGAKHGGSLALHPALYCYDNTGKFIPKAFIGAIEFVRSLEQRDKFFEFTKHREAFEAFLIKHPHIMMQISRSQGSGGRRGVPAVVALYNFLFDGLRSGLSQEKIIESMQGDPSLSFLDWNVPPENDSGRKFSAADKAAAVIGSALEKDICPECGGRLYIKDRSHDHKIQKKAGGKSVRSNLDLTHPYCNTGYKEARLAGRKK
jgi:hypothetical protein